MVTCPVRPFVPSRSRTLLVHGLRPLRSLACIGLCAAVSVSARAASSHEPQLTTQIVDGRDLDRPSMLATHASRSGIVQLWDGRSLGVASQEFTDHPDASTAAFDDVHVPEATSFKHLRAFGVERGDASQNESVHVRIQERASWTKPGRILVDATGRQEGAELVFDFDPPLRLEAGTYWITAWVRRPYQTGGQWFWAGTLDAGGAGVVVHTPGAGMGLGSRPFTLKDAGLADGGTSFEFGTDTGPEHQPCDTILEWMHLQEDIEGRAGWANQSSPYRRLLNDPLPMWIDAVDLHGMKHRCTTCDDTQVTSALVAQVKYQWWVVQGGGHFVEFVDGPAITPYEKQAALYVPDTFALNEERTVEIAAYAHHDDLFKGPSHQSAEVRFVLKIKREETVQSKTIGEVTVEIVKPEFVYTVASVTPMPVVTGTIPMPVLGDCVPVSIWQSGSPIFAVSPTPPTSPLYPMDLVVLTIEASDTDHLELSCTPAHPDQCDKTHLQRGPEDAFLYVWSASDGFFPCGNRGKSVVYEGSELGGPVNFMVTVSNLPGRYLDPSVTEQFSFSFDAESRSCTAAAIAWIPQIHPTIAVMPAATKAVPAAPPYPPGAVALPFEGGGLLGWGWRFLGGQWESFNRHMPWLTPVVVHPWALASYGLWLSANPTPPTSMISMDALRTFATSKQYRSILAFEFEARIRRDTLLDIFEEDGDLDVIADAGWTPMAVGPVVSIGDILEGLGLSPFSAGEGFMPTLRFEGLCSDAIQADLTMAFRVGAKGNLIGVGMTNRDAPWIDGHLTQTVKRANPVPDFGDLDFGATPAFPMWKSFLGALTMSPGPIEAPGEYQVDFINRGAKSDPAGL